MNAKRNQRAVGMANHKILAIVALIVAFAGLFAAGVLAAGHLLDIPVPCGRSRGCLAVALHPSSKVSGIPIAFLGVAVYLVIIFLLGRFGRARWARLLCVTLAGSGTVASVALLAYSRRVIGATCVWCVASGVAMALVFVLSILLLKRAQSLLPYRPTIVWSLAFLTAAAIGVQAGLMQRAASRPPIPAERLAGIAVEQFNDSAKSLGPSNAPVTIIMFADLWCPACRAAHKSLIKYQRTNPAGVRLVFRHLPLWEIRGHQSSRAAAALSEIAGEQGQFWSFVEAVYAQHNQLDRAGYLELIRSLGLKASEAEARLSDPQDRAVTRVLDDEHLAERLGTTATPTFILLVSGQEPISANQRTLPRLLNSPQVLAWLGQVAQASQR